MNAYRNKLLNAVLYFAKDTKYPNLTKILKLLYFLDFTHFKQTGYPSIGLEYYAWDYGPVPKNFYEEVKDGHVPEDFAGKFTIIPSDRWEKEHPERTEFLFKAIAKPNDDVFTPRELKIIENLCVIYRDATANQMKEITHLPKAPWDTTKRTAGRYQYIDYLLSVDDTSPFAINEARERFKEHLEMVNNFSLNSTKVK